MNDKTEIIIIKENILNVISEVEEEFERRRKSMKENNLFSIDKNFLFCLILKEEIEKLDIKTKKIVNEKIERMLFLNSKAINIIFFFDNQALDSLKQ